MNVALFNGESIVRGYDSLKGIFYTKQGQCLEYRAVRLKTRDGGAGRSAILLKMRRNWHSYRFKALNEEKEQAPMSILDFAVIPLEKPRRPREKNQGEGSLNRKAFNLFPIPNANISTRMETRFLEEEEILWQLPLFGHPNHINVCRSEDPNIGDYATWPLAMSFGEQDKLRSLEGKGKSLPIVLTLDNEHAKTEENWRRYEELLAAEQEMAQEGQLRLYEIGFAGQE